MDRWTDRDADLDDDGHRVPRGKVATFGMSAFVKTGVIGAQAAAVAGGVTVVPSRREQKKQEAVKLMPPPPSVPQRQPSAGPAAPSFEPPAWCATPPDGFVLEVYKDTAVVQEIPLTRAATVFGRHSSADVPLDHASLSRFHAAIAYHKKLGRMMAMDLGSVHGTFVDGQQLRKGDPLELKGGSEVRFAASTRCYVLRRSTPHMSRGAPPAKRSRVKFADEDDTRGGGLEQIIGYSDGGEFTARVGPSSSKPDEPGRFAALVKSTVMPAKPKGGDGIGGEPEAGSELGRQDSGEGVQHVKLKEGVQRKLKEVLEGKVSGPLVAPKLKHAGSLFDDLPPPSKG